MEGSALEAWLLGSSGASVPPLGKPKRRKKRSLSAAAGGPFERSVAVARDLRSGDEVPP